MTKANQLDIDAFVHRVVDWSQTLQRCADVGVSDARQALGAGTIGFADFNTALQRKVTVTQSCIAMVDAASTVLSKVAEAELEPIEQATDRLKDAMAKLKDVEDGLTLLSKLVVASAALSAALIAPGLASIAAAASAVGKLGADIADG